MRHFKPFIISRATMLTALSEWASENGFRLATDKRGFLRLVPGCVFLRGAAQ